MQKSEIRLKKHKEQQKKEMQMRSEMQKLKKENQAKINEKFKLLEKLRKQEIMTKMSRFTCYTQVLNLFLANKEDQQLVQKVVESGIKNKRDELVKSMNDERNKLKNMYAKWKELDMKSVSKKGKLIFYILKLYLTLHL